ncbi:MAG: DUF493 domain-containing protein [Victivallaceae bacterium]|nr:DUF493 domain-containing protein [Victivallaceae bacterium]
MERLEELKFPVVWNYRIITDITAERCQAELQAVLDQVGGGVKLQPSRDSRGGRYRAYAVPVTVNSREELENVSNKLAAVEGVKFLL